MSSESILIFSSVRFFTPYVMTSQSRPSSSMPRWNGPVKVLPDAAPMMENSSCATLTVHGLWSLEVGDWPEPLIAKPAPEPLDVLSRALRGMRHFPVKSNSSSRSIALDATLKTWRMSSDPPALTLCDDEPPID